MTTKRVSETILLTADFSSELRVDEHLVSCAVDAYAHTGDGYYSEDFNISSAEYVGIVLKAGGEERHYKTFPVLGRSTARLIVFGGEQEATAIIDSASVEDGHTKDITEKSASARITGGSVGSAYRILFTATTNYGNTYVQEFTVEVVAD